MRQRRRSHLPDVDQLTRTGGGLHGLLDAVGTLAPWRTRRRKPQTTLLLATLFIMISGLAVPEAFAGRGTLFAVTYTVVRLLHLVLYADASRRGNASWSAIAGFGTTVVIGTALLIAGSFLHGTGRAALWLVAVATDYAGPAWLTRERLRGLQRVAVAHRSAR